MNIIVCTGKAKKLPRQVIVGSPKELVKWCQRSLKTLRSNGQWGEIWLYNGGGNRELVVSQAEFPRFIAGLLDRQDVLETKDVDFYFSKLDRIKEAMDDGKS